METHLAKLTQPIANPKIVPMKERQLAASALPVPMGVLDSLWAEQPRRTMNVIAVGIQEYRSSFDKGRVVERDPSQKKINKAQKGRTSVNPFVSKQTQEKSDDSNNDHSNGIRLTQAWEVSLRTTYKAPRDWLTMLSLATTRRA